MRRISLVAALAAVGLLSACGIAGQRPKGYEKRDYHTDPGLEFRPVPLSEIMRNPQEGSAVQFDAMLNRRDESVWQAYYTPFRQGEYKSFSVWPADAAVWDVRGRGRSIPTLYLAADSPEIAELYAIETYSPVRIRGVVRSVFDSRPWIEVHYVEALDPPWFSDESLGNLIRGLDAARAGSAKAIALLDEALGGPISPAAEAAAYKAMGWVYLGQKQYAEAARCYDKALDAMPGDRQALDGLSRARRKAARGEWADEPVSKDEGGPATNWKAMYTELHADHETNCKALAEAHAKCGETVQAISVERAAAVKAHEECGDLKKQVEAKDAEIKASAEKVTALETERDELKKKVEGGGADAEGMKKQIEEKDAALKTANEKVTALEAERDELKKRAEGGGDPEALKKQIEAKDAEIKAAQTKVTELEQQVKDRDESIKKQREEIDRLTEELKKKEGN